MPAVGLILVHGIGNQPPGALAREMAARLRDTEAGQKSAPTSSSEIRDEKANKISAPTLLMQQIAVGGVPVCVCEAHWAALSHPDNPPEIRLAPYLLQDLLDTVSSAWHSSHFNSLLRRVTRRGTAKQWLFVWGAAAILITLLFAAVYRERPKVEFRLLLLSAPLTLLFFIFLWHFMARILRYRRARLRHASRMRQAGELLLWLPLAYGLTAVHFYLPLISAEVLLFFFGVLLLALSLNYVALIPVVFSRKLGQLLGRTRLDAVRRWIHRFAWIMLILPVQSFMQATKASGNLFSLVFTDRRGTIKSTAVAGFLGVFAFFLMLMVFCELLIVPPLLGVLPDSEAVLYIVLVPVCMTMWKASLIAIDLLLDISNYHLAARSDRHAYFQVIEQAVGSLQKVGCSEVHVLAHSLGSVITYDWLRSLSTKTSPVSTFHTIGSPLDKFWYIDHSRSERMADEKGMAERLSRGWINYWTHSDPVSGSLDHYGTGVRGVHNIQLRKLGWFLVSHTRYWENPIVIARLREGIIAAAQS